MTMQVSSPASIVLPSVKLASITLAAPAANIDFANIDQSYSSLQVVLTGRCDTSAGTGVIKLQLNGDAGANYDIQLLQWVNAAASVFVTLAGTPPTGMSIGDKGVNVSDRGQLSVFAPHYAETTFFKTVETRSQYIPANAGATNQRLSAVKWRNTAAITEITLIPSAGNFDIGTIADLYGIH